MRGDVSARGFYARRRVCIFDIRVTDTDAASYNNRSSAKVLANAEKEKEDKYSKACKDRQRDFCPMVYSVDGLPGRESKDGGATSSCLAGGQMEVGILRGCNFRTS